MEQLTIPLQIKPELNIFRIDLDNYSSVKAQLEECFKTINYKLKDKSLSLSYVENGLRISFTALNKVFDEVYSLTETYSDSYFYLLFITKYTKDTDINAIISVNPTNMTNSVNFHITRE